MRRALRARNKLGFINGSLCKPASSKDTLFSAWERCNDMIVTWIQNSISTTVKSSVAFGDELAVYDPMPTCTCGQLTIMNARYQRDNVIQFLMGLNDKYSNVRDQIMMIDPIPSVNKVFSLIQLQEQHHQIISAFPNPESMALATHCRIQGHTLETCFKVGNAQVPSYTHCKQIGHVAEKCYKLHGYPPSHKFYKGKNVGSYVNQDLSTWTTIGMVEVKGSLYHLLPVVIYPNAFIEALSSLPFNSKPFAASVMTGSNSSELWHCRLGHASNSRLVLIDDSNVKRQFQC
ncbi:hypothetical protein F2P56_014299 [Juglans regia]|uniref:Retrotransposon Copia-like N-terminal domain-containing protein n=1 Tax=Juglans regia TaxID=51240 RepID=A0A833XDF4_JUGRE|nr:hypothetical protein F2P56_014299 [Juglans regia]